MNWKTFKETLQQHPDLELQFKYTVGRLVDAGYHITEIKQAPITSVDCGGVMNKWTEVVMQLWVPEHSVQLRPMKVKKALSIIDIVEKVLPLSAEAIVKIEFGNAEFDTRQMLPVGLVLDEDSLTVELHADTVQCKATTRGGTCGTEDSQPKLLNLADPANTRCTPGGGCC